MRMDYASKHVPKIKMSYIVSSTVFLSLGYYSYILLYIVYSHDFKHCMLVESQSPELGPLTVSQLYLLLLFFSFFSHGVLFPIP